MPASRQGDQPPLVTTPIGGSPAAHAKLGTTLAVEIRGRLEPAQVVKRPFYRR